MAAGSWAEAHRGELQKFAKKIAQSRNRVDLSDIVQLTLSEAARYPVPSAAKPAQLAWLKEALRHNLSDETRMIHAQKRDANRERPLTSKAAVNHDSPSRLATKKEEIQRLVAYFDRLPPDQREAMQLRYVDGLTMDAIVEQLGSTRPTIAGLIRRALITLRDRLRTDSEKAGDGRR